MRFKKHSHQDCNTCAQGPRDGERCVKIIAVEGLTKDKNGCGKLEDDSAKTYGTCTLGAHNNCPYFVAEERPI